MLTNDQIRFPDFSVNRGKYSSPRDVLRPTDTGWGVATFLVRDIPPTLTHGTTQYDFKVIHLPESTNYAHSEVRTFVGGTRLLNKDDVKQTSRKQFRNQLRSQMQIAIHPALP